MTDIDATIFDYYPCENHIFCVMLPIDTDMVWGTTQKRYLIHHNESRFIWIDGSSSTFPTLIIPLNEEEKDALYDYSKCKIFDDVLEYLSLLTLRSGLRVDIKSDVFKAYSGQWCDALDYLHAHPRTNSLSGYHWLPDPPAIFSFNMTDKQKMILGLLREAYSCNNIFYAVLACSKVLEHFFPDPKGKVEYINRNFDAAKKFYLDSNKILGLDDLKKFQDFVKDWCETTDAGDKTTAGYLWYRVRHAIAHANHGKHFIKPYKYSDYYEMYFAREALKALTFYLIYNHPKFSDL